MQYTEIIDKVSEELSLPREVVDLAYKSSFEFIRGTISSLPLKDALTEEDFNKLRCNFNLPSLGKLACTYERYLGMKERFKYLNKLKEKYED